MINAFDVRLMGKFRLHLIIYLELHVKVHLKIYIKSTKGAPVIALKGTLQTSGCTSVSLVHAIVNA